MKDKIILSKENIETLAELVKPYLTEKDTSILSP